MNSSTPLRPRTPIGNGHDIPLFIIVPSSSSCACCRLVNKKEVPPVVVVATDDRSTSSPCFSYSSHGLHSTGAVISKVGACPIQSSNSISLASSSGQHKVSISSLPPSHTNTNDLSPKLPKRSRENCQSPPRLPKRRGSVSDFMLLEEQQSMNRN